MWRSMTVRGRNGVYQGTRRSKPARPADVVHPMARLNDVVTYLEMFAHPGGIRIHAPPGKLALMRAEECSVSFYRYLYETVGTPWLWFERRVMPDEELTDLLADEKIEIFVLYVGGTPAGYFELNAGEPRETELNYFGLIPEFIGRRLGPFLLQAALDPAWSRPIQRFLVPTCPSHPPP